MNTVLLLAMDGTDGSTTFVDSSPYSKTPSSVNGNSQLDTTVKKFGTASLQLDGTGDYVAYANSNDWDPGAGDYTIEFDVYLNENTRLQVPLQWRSGSPSEGWTFFIDVDNLRFMTWNSTLGGDNVAVDIQHGEVLETDRWYHIVVTKEGSVWRLFLDGAVAAAGTELAQMSSHSEILTIGRDTGGEVTTRDLNGYLDNIRITKGVARYVVDGFTPPTAAYPISDSVPPANGAFFLLPLDGTDGATTTTEVLNGTSVTIGGSGELDSAQAKFGATSYLCDGPITFSAQTLIDNGMASGNWTVEFWYRPDGTAVTSDRLFQTRDGDLFSGISIGHDSTSSITFLLDNSGTTPWDYTGTSVSVTDNVWQHIALVRNGTNVTLYKDGVSSLSTTYTVPIYLNGADDCIIGAQTGGRANSGWIDDFRISFKAEYTANFTPPASAHPTTIATGDERDIFFDSISLLAPLDGTDGATTATDLSNTGHTLTFRGAAELDTAQKRFGTAAVLLDGVNGTGVTADDHVDFTLGSGDFTVECWVRYNVDPSTQQMYVAKYNNTGGNNREWWLGTNATATELYFAYSTDGSNAIVGPSGAWNPVVDTWYHLAASRHGNAMYVFADGVLLNTYDATGVTFFDGTAQVGIGCRQQDATYKFVPNGWIDDVRVTKGVARYVGNFVRPTAPHPTQIATSSDPFFENVLLLLPMDGNDAESAFPDASAYTHTLNPVSVTTSTEQIKFGTASAKITGGLSRGLYTSETIIPSTTDSFTIEAWVYLLGTPYSGASRAASPFHPIVQESAGGGASDQGLYIGDVTSGSGQLTFYRSPGVGTTFSVSGGLGKFSNNVWTHIACCYDNDSARMNLFVNGELVAGDTVPGGGWYDQPSRDFQIGDWFEAGYAQWQATANMHIDDLRISNVVRYTADFTPPSKAFSDIVCVEAGDLPLIEDYTTVIQTVTDWDNGQTWNNFWGWGWKPDGTKFVTVNNTNDRIYGFDFGTAFDFTTTSNNSANPGQSVSVVGLDVMFNEDGTKYSTWSWFSANTMRTYNASTAYEPSTGDTLISQADFGSYSTSDSEVYWIDRTGEHLFIVTSGNSPDKIIHFKMSTLWDVTTAVLQSDEYDFVAAGIGVGTPGRMYVSPTGRDMLFSDSADDSGIVQLRMSVPYNLNTIVHISTLAHLGPRGGGVWMSEDTTKLITGPGANDSYDIQVRVIPLPGSDPELASVSLLLQPEEADGATTTVDKSNSAHTITFNANAQVDTGKTLFGQPVFEFDGDGDYLSIPDSTDFNLAGGAWTFECHAQIRSADINDGVADGFCLMSQWDEPNDIAYYFAIAGNDSCAIQISENGSGVLYRLGTADSFDPQANTWHHIAFVNDTASTRIRSYVDGVQTDSVVYGGAFNDSANELTIGGRPDPRAGTFYNWFDGWIGNIRLTKGVCRYPGVGAAGTPFTPPTGPYPEF